MIKWLIASGALVLAAAAIVMSCGSSNDCESFYKSLCGSAAYKTDTNAEQAKARQQWCTCVTDGPDGLESDYQKLDCSTELEKTAALDPSVENDAQDLHQCRVRAQLLSEFGDTYVKTCFQTDGKKDCKDTAKTCSDGCGDSCKDACSAGSIDGGGGGALGEACSACLNACESDCARKYPCDAMCG